MPEIKVAIVEDLEEVLEGLSTFISLDKDLKLTAVYRTAEAAALELPLVKPDIVIMDINLPGISGIECISKIKAVSAQIQFMMFTVYENDEQVFEALKAGASGYLLKKTPPAQIIAAIKELYQGGSPMSANIARKLVAHFQEKKDIVYDEAAILSVREKEVLEQLSKGMLYKEIADELGISFNTVRQHIGNIYAKLHVQNKTEAINKVYGRKF
jgi:DNA-binding NarL/FixJ family response regulator